MPNSRAARLSPMAGRQRRARTLVVAFGGPDASGRSLATWCRGVVVGSNLDRRLVAEAVGTGSLVIFGLGSVPETGKVDHLRLSLPSPSMRWGPREALTQPCRHLLHGGQGSLALARDHSLRDRPAGRCRAWGAADRGHLREGRCGHCGMAREGSSEEQREVRYRVGLGK